jgi:hypothetical protein
VTLEAHELLRRLSVAIRGEVGPAIADEYTRTQAFMASVILERLAKQLALAEEHERAAATDLAQLHRALSERLESPPPEMAEALDCARSGATIDALGPLIEAIYDWHDPRGSDALDLIRSVLRRDIDRRMQVAQ